jgi:acyl carrier protein
MTETARQQIEHRVRRVLRDRLEIDIARLEGSGGLLAGSGLGLDSIEALSLAVGIEEEFALDIQDDELTSDLFHSVDSLTDYVMRRSQCAANTK